jgi:hypothetical protein
MLKMVKSVLEYLFYLLNYVLLILVFLHYNLSKLPSLTVNNSMTRELTVNWY